MAFNRESTAARIDHRGHNDRRDTNGKVPRRLRQTCLRYPSICLAYGCFLIVPSVRAAFY